MVRWGGEEGGKRGDSDEAKTRSRKTTSPNQTGQQAGGFYLLYKVFTYLQVIVGTYIQLHM